MDSPKNYEEEVQMYRQGKLAGTPAFDLESELLRVSDSQNLARRLGQAQMAADVHGWLIRHAASVPLEAFKELNAIVMRAAK